MLSKDKFRKALGIRALACAALGLAAFSSAPARSQVAPKNPAEGKAACEQELNDRFTFMETLDKDSKVSPEKVDQAFLAENCKMNVQSGVNLKGGIREDDKTRGLAIATDAAGIKYLGACELSHISVKKHYAELKEKYLAYCDYVETASNELTNCDGVTSKGNVSDCVSRLAKTERTLKEKFETINKFIGNAKNKLEKFQKTNETIANEFDRDRAQLANPNAQLAAAAGFENKLDDYKAALMPASRVTTAAQKGPLPDHEGALIAEQRLAHDNVEHYLKNIEEFKVEKHALSDQLAEQEEKLKKLKDGMKSDGSNLGSYASTAAAAAPAAQSLMSKPASTSSSSGPGISGAVAAIPAAVALAGAAKGSSGASSSTAALPAGTPPAAHEAPTTTLGAAAALANGNRSPASDNSEGKTVATEAKNGEAATGSYSPLSFGADGSSRMGALKKGQKAPDESPSPAQQANYANNGTDLGGGMPLSSRGGSHGSAPAPGTEVTSLLGQMKSLFNFDDPAPGGGGGGVFGGAMPAMAPGMPGSGEAAQAGGEYAENAPADSETVAGNGDPAAYEQGAPADNQADSLFVRVHKRHRRYVERGLLTANLGRVR